MQVFQLGTVLLRPGNMETRGVGCHDNEEGSETNNTSL